jgi:hypothetical protein
MSLVATALAMHTTVSYVHVFNSTFIQIYHSIGTIPARFNLIWFSGFRGEDLNVIFYQICLIFIIGIYWLKEKFQRKMRNIC